MRGIYIMKLMPGNKDGSGGVITSCVCEASREYAPNDVSKLPQRIVQFLGLIKENSEVIRLQDVKSLRWLRDRLKKKGGDFGDDLQVALSPSNSLVLSYTPDEATANNRALFSLPILPCMSTHLDGAHHGLSDWYPEIEADILEAICSKKDFTTGWYSSKKEIASARISRIRDIMTVEASISDDFDTQGNGVVKHHGKGRYTLNTVRKAIDQALSMAEKDLKSNKAYRGWAIGERSGPRQCGRKRINYIETYLECLDGSEAPSGDCYRNWGFQDETSKIPEKDRKKLESLIPLSTGSPVYAGHFVATEWEE
jgi:hypothetical protein